VNVFVFLKRNVRENMKIELSFYTIFNVARGFIVYSIVTALNAESRRKLYVGDRVWKFSFL